MRRVGAPTESEFEARGFQKSIEAMIVDALGERMAPYWT
jgi:hypothetical protein